MEIVILTTMKKHNKHRVINITRLKLIHQGGYRICNYANNSHNTVWSNMINSLIQL